MESLRLTSNEFHRSLHFGSSQSEDPSSKHPDGGKTDFESIRSECLRQKSLYEDPGFPPSDTSVYFSCKPNYQFEWLRPHDIAGRYGLNPELYIQGSRYDLMPGLLGDYWLLQAATVLHNNQELMRQVIPSNQSFSSGIYAGIFRFRFWRYGRWQQVIIDDRLPTVRGEMSFIHSKDPCHFWGALLEKAYAKLLGSYEALKSGFLMNALHSLTGGLVECYRLQDDAVPLPVNIVNALFKSMERHTIILAHVKPTQSRLGTVLQNGLITGKVYNITDIREIKLISDISEVPITLVRLSNPWGEKIVWTGPWGERSQEWTNISAYERKSMGLICRDESEFWMDFKDFLQAFDSLELCHQLPDIVPLARPPRVWRGLEFHGYWRKGVNAGGRPVCTETHHYNPQYHIVLAKRDEDEQTRCTCLVELTQKDRRRHKNKGRINVDIGFVVYKCSSAYSLPLPQSYFEQHTFQDRCDFFANGEQVSKRFLLELGEYVLIPSTYSPHTDADFMVRVLLEEDNTVELVEDWSENTLDPGAILDLTNKDQDYVLNLYLDAADEANTGHFVLSLTACKKLVSLMDTDQVARVGYNEFLYLWNSLCTWKRAFQSFDKTSSGSLEAYHLKPLLGSLGYHLTIDVLTAIVLRFADDNLQIRFSELVECLCKITSILNVYKSLQDGDKMMISLDQVR
ncbi:hypothetical protein LSH36_94g04017 [Paralvinella palmiformis]|uniref:Calpain catalytic domain-containing protein n=1 Tax=Paralvinella palmiformis TaxID=53620 RepID=A0AAD9K0F9_9ANNE|nr:hypothetical protein LSH36_94g04017 [Paralvinella palmiformis]